MGKAFGIVTRAGKNIYVDGLQQYCTIGAFSFLGRYRVVDFPISNLSNSGIDRIQVYVGEKPRSVVDHLGTGRHYNINSKRGKLQILFSNDTMKDNLYNTDISNYLENLEYIEKMQEPYVVITPGYMVYSMNFRELISAHIETGADITMLYHSTDNAKESYLNLNVLNLNRQKGIESIELNQGTAKNKNIFMDTYVMKKELFVDLIKKAKKTSSMYTLIDIVKDMCEAKEMDIRGYAHRGYFASISDFKSYFDANLALIDYKEAKTLFESQWPIYTRTNDSSPTKYLETADVKSSVVSNGCLIEGTVRNSIIGRGCVIKKGAVVNNSIILADTVIGEDVHVENQVVDKQAKLIRMKEIVSAPETPGYVRRNDTL